MPVLKTARLRIGFGAQQKGQQVKFRRRGARSTVLHQLDFVRNDRVAPAHAFGAFGVATLFDVQAERIYRAITIFYQVIILKLKNTIIMKF